jgi:hypothetical protein
MIHQIDHWDGRVHSEISSGHLQHRQNRQSVELPRKRRKHGEL